MTRLIGSLFLLGVAVVSASCATAQTPVGGPASKSVRVKPAQNAAANAPQATEGTVPPATLDKLRADLASQQSVAAGEVKVIRAEAVNWPDGSLGCPQPGMMYTQAIVPGYRVELEASGKRYTYHASEKGYFKLCTSKALPVDSAR
jgi:hypothetical protein